MATAEISCGSDKLEPNLLATKLVYRAVSVVLSDKGFSLPTVPARTSQLAAEKVLEWSSE